MSPQFRTSVASTRPIESLSDLGPGRLLAESVPLAPGDASTGPTGAASGDD
jgi:hypothetical protein